jgi:hypothetical protein
MSTSSNNMHRQHYTSINNNYSNSNYDENNNCNTKYNLNSNKTTATATPATLAGLRPPQPQQQL